MGHTSHAWNVEGALYPVGLALELLGVRHLTVSEPDTNGLQCGLFLLADPENIV